MNDIIKSVCLDKLWYSNYVNAQLNNLFPDNLNHLDELLEVMPFAIERLVYSLEHVKIKSHQNFTHIHSDLYAQFLYFLSNSAWKKEYTVLAQKIFYLNKSLHGLNCMYSTELPKIFIFFHIVGTVLGKANYSDFLVVNQNVTVGTNNEKIPSIGKGVMLRPNSSVIGNSIIGDFTSLSINATVFEEKIPEQSIVIGSSPNLQIKASKRLLIEDIFYL